MVMAFGDNRLETSDGIQSDEIYVTCGLQDSLNGAIYIKVAAFEDAIRVIELPMDDQ